ncbi:hypothetical protein JCM33374_g1604 [Metschnikowia sp. JCM 33374]|nr:hypothetical protein JCM33374_g1604 [Metschnikowia sp. JCM 33374]
MKIGSSLISLWASSSLWCGAAIAANTQDRFRIQHGQTNQYPNMADGAKVARTLVNRESLMNVNTIQRVSDSVEVPTSSMEYYADCDSDGDPYWLVIDIGSPARNIAHGSSYSFTIRAGDHPAADHVDPEYPGGISSSPAGSPRLTLKGDIVNVTNSSSEDISNLEKCFIKRHPDAKWWLPSNTKSPHKAHWVKIIVSDVYIIGGFGDRAYIGPIPGDDYHGANILH